MKKKLSKTEIIKIAKHYFGKDRSFIKEHILSKKFDRKTHKEWKEDIKAITNHPTGIRFNINGDVIKWIKNDQLDKIDWNWIGDISWEIKILLNPNIDKGYDWENKLALKCGGTCRMITFAISDIIPCYTYDCHYMTINKKENYYEFGPIRLTEEEKILLNNIQSLFKRKGLQRIETSFSKNKRKGLYSDCAHGDATLFDVLFSDLKLYTTTEINRYSDKEVIEKSGTKFFWQESYNKNGTLKERTERRYTKSGDNFKIVLDASGCITKMSVIRIKIENRKYEQFDLDIIDLFKKRQKSIQRRKKYPVLKK